MKSASLIVLFAALAAGPVTVIAAGSAPVEESKPAERSASSGASQYYNTGVALMRSKNFADAQAHFEKALKLRQDFAEAHNNLAYCLRKQGPWNYE
jgi:Flp pilus assembly protein TadD